MPRGRISFVLFLVMPLILGSLFFSFVPMNSELDQKGTNQVPQESPIEIYEYELFDQEHTLSSTPSQIAGTGDPLISSEYGNRTDTFTNEQMTYNSGTQTTTTANLSVPMGEDWEGYQVYTNVTSVTENRTWLVNADWDTNTNWTYLTHDEPSAFGAYTNTLTSEWLSNGDASGTGCARFWMDGYYYDAGGGLYGDWYDVGDKAYAVQNLTIVRGEVSAIGISLNYWADINWGSMTGFFEIFVSIGDPDNGGIYLWQKSFDAISSSMNWLDSGYIDVSPSLMTLPNVSIWVGLRTTALEWWRPDVEPQARVDNLVIYVAAESTPEDVNLQMNGVDVDNVLNGTTPLFGLGTAWFTPVSPWTSGLSYANFSWTPTPNPPDPNLDLNIAISVDVRIYARRHNVQTFNSTELFTNGDNFIAENDTAIRWETNHYAAVPGGYSSRYFFNVSLPMNRDIDFVAEPYYRAVNLTSGWIYGAPGDGLVNISAFEITQVNQNGFWLLQGSSPNIISNLEVWDNSLSQWTRTHTFRANEDTRFRATVSSAYENDIVHFAIYNSTEDVWVELQGVVDNSGYAVTSFVNLDAVDASVGLWEVQAFVDDTISGGAIHNVGFYRRSFSIDHRSGMYVKYPTGSETSWMTNVTYGELVLLQMRVNDSDNGDLLPGGVMTYSWNPGSGSVSDLGTGEYSVTLDTNELPSNGQYSIDFTWTKDNYDSIFETFTLNVYYTTDLFSSDAPGVDVPRGYDAQLNLEYKDQLLNGITGALITCNWTNTFTVTPDGGNPGNYLLELQTDAVDIGTYAVEITASREYYEPRSVLLSVQVRELYTSAIPSTSSLSLPVGYTTSFSITYTDTDNNLPITGSASAITCNWSSIHSFGDQNYTVTETGTPGVYDVAIFSEGSDVLDSYVIEFNVQKYGAQNHTFYISIELRTHLTSFYLVNPINPTPYTGSIQIYVMYYDSDASVGIENGSTIGYHVHMVVSSSGIPSLNYLIENGTEAGEYLISIPAHQWGSIGLKDLTIEVSWSGPTSMYTSETINTDVSVTITPTDIYIGESPLMTPYGENATFTVIYFDVGNDTGIVNGTGIYSDNVRLYIEVLTSGQVLEQSLMIISEVDFINNAGEYRIEFNTSFLSGLISCELKLWFNWTKAALPYYENQSLLITIHSTYRNTLVDWIPIPLTAFDELVNFSFTYRDVLSDSIILNSSHLQIYISGYSFTIYYDGNATGVFMIEVDTSAWSPGTHSFYIDVIWSGKPYYQNKTSLEIPISVRERYAELVHGSYSPVQFENNVTITFTFRDLDDYTTVGMNGGTLTLDTSLIGFYWVLDNGDGTYSVILSTITFANLGTFTVNVSIVYNGARYCEDATDFFYVTITERRTQLTSELADLAPYLSLANVTVIYTDDTTNNGITSAGIYASCVTSLDLMELGVNYWVTDLGGGEYLISISTVALGTFGSYTIDVIANWTGSPYYMERQRSVNIEVSRRPAALMVTKSPLNTPYKEYLSFEIAVSDGINGTHLLLDKSILILSYGSGTVIPSGQYELVGDGNRLYTISFNSTLITSVLSNSILLFIKFHWGDVAPYYSNSTSSTEVDITSRLTQASVVSTLPASYGYNTTAVIIYSDYLSNEAIIGASVTVLCTNHTPIQSWIIDNGDGSYSVKVNSSNFPNIGRYYFKVNFTWIGTPYYQNVTSVSYSIIVNAVSTVLSLVISETTTYHLGDIVLANITFQAVDDNTGISDALVQNNWVALYGTYSNITQIGNGVYRLYINTSGLNAQQYSFNINASKYLHFNKSISVNILLAAIPIVIDIEATPNTPIWGEILIIVVNITDMRTGAPIIGGSVNVTIQSDTYNLVDQANGLYQISILTSNYDSGEYTLVVSFILTNHETRQRNFQIRIERITSVLSAQINPQSTVNGDTITAQVDYLILSNSTPIVVGTVTYSWIGGSGTLVWNSTAGRYVGEFIVSEILVGTHQILIQATSTNYKNLNTLVTLEIRDISSNLIAYDFNNILFVASGDLINITTYLNNTDLDTPITGANLTCSISDYVGNLTDLGNGYYTILISSTFLEIRDWVLTVSSLKEGYAPASVQFTITIQKVTSQITILSDALVEVFYRDNVTYRFNFWDTHNDLGIVGATTTYLLSIFSGSLIDLGNGTYILSFNSTTVSASYIEYDISISFQKDRYEYSYSLVKVLVLPITTEIVGPLEISIPVGDDYTQVYYFVDTVKQGNISDAIATAIWEYGTHTLTNLGGGAFAFGGTETGLTRLEVRAIPYLVRISFTKGNYSRTEITLVLTIREINTELRYSTVPPTSGFVDDEILIFLTYWDLDHDVPIIDALNSTDDSSAIQIDSEVVNYGNGTYLFAFRIPDIGRHEIVINLYKNDYSPSEVVFVIYAVATPEQLAMAQTFQWGTIGLLLFSVLAAFYMKVLSVPRMLRWLRKMISLLGKGKIPSPAPVRTRRQMMLEWMNEELAGTGIVKELEDISPSPLEVEALDVDVLLSELALVIGLTPDDISILKRDLDKMRPSERAGFVSEVLRQERARRAIDLVEIERTTDDAIELERKPTEDELLHFRVQLLSMGIDADEADLMVDQARHLSKAEIDALLEQIGGMKG